MGIFKKKLCVYVDIMGTCMMSGDLYADIRRRMPDAKRYFVYTTKMLDKRCIVVNAPQLMEEQAECSTIGYDATVKKWCFAIPAEEAVMMFIERNVCNSDSTRVSLRRVDVKDIDGNDLLVYEFR